MRRPNDSEVQRSRYESFSGRPFRMRFGRNVQKKSLVLPHLRAKIPSSAPRPPSIDRRMRIRYLPCMANNCSVYCSPATTDSACTTFAYEPPCPWRTAAAPCCRCRRVRAISSYVMHGVVQHGHITQSLPLRERVGMPPRRVVLFCFVVHKVALGPERSCQHMCMR